MSAVADAVAGALQEASRGGLVKCPECDTLNGKSSAKCKNCGHDLKQVAKDARNDGRSHVAEAGVRDAIESRRRWKRWEQAHGHTVAAHAKAVDKLPVGHEYKAASGVYRGDSDVRVQHLSQALGERKSQAGFQVHGANIAPQVHQDPVAAAKDVEARIKHNQSRKPRSDLMLPTPEDYERKAAAAEAAGQSREARDLRDTAKLMRKRKSVAEAVAAVLEADGKGGSAKGRRAGRTRRGKFGDLPTLATGKRVAPKADGDTPTAKGSAESAGPTSVAESVVAVLEAELHPRDRLGQWREKTAGEIQSVAQKVSLLAARDHGEMSVPGGIKVKSHWGDSITVTDASGAEQHLGVNHRNSNYVGLKVAAMSAASTDPDSPGGATPVTIDPLSASDDYGQSVLGQLARHSPAGAQGGHRTRTQEAVVAVLEADGPKMKLGNKPGKSNWVERAGGLPNYIKRIAEHIKGKNPGWDDGRCIAVAKNAAQKMCASGDVNLPGKQNVNAGSRAEACAAVASWNAKRGKGKVSEAALDVLGGDEFDPRQMTAPEHREVIRVVRALEDGGLEALA